MHIIVLNFPKLFQNITKFWVLSSYYCLRIQTIRPSSVENAIETDLWEKRVKLTTVIIYLKMSQT